MATSVPTDIIANYLSIRLFLFGIAALSFYEALKLDRPRSYFGWAAFALFGLSGMLLTPIAELWPIGVLWLGGLVANPVTWFVLLVGAYSWFRPRWIKQQPSADAHSQQIFPPTVEQSTEIETRLARLKHNHGNLVDHVQALNTRLDKLEPVVSRLAIEAHIRRLNAAADRLGEIANDIQVKLELHRVAYAKPPPTGIITGWYQQLMNLPEYLEGAQKVIKLLTGADVDLLQHPKYTLNPMRRVDGDTDVADPERRQDYRRTYEQGELALKAVEALAASLRNRAFKLGLPSSLSEAPLIKDGKPV